MGEWLNISFVEVAVKCQVSTYSRFMQAWMDSSSPSGAPERKITQPWILSYLQHNSAYRMLQYPLQNVEEGEREGSIPGG